MSASPFFYGGRLPKAEYFYDRENDLEKLNGLLNRRMSPSIIGPRTIGKTSLLDELIRRNKDSNDLIFIYFDLSSGNLGSSNAFWIECLKFAKKKLSEKSASPEEPNQAFLSFKATLERFEGEKRLILILDELEMIGKKSKRDFSISFHRNLRSLVQNSGIGLITSSRSPLEDILSLQDSLTSPLINICNSYFITPFKKDDAVNFFEDRFNLCGINISKIDIDLLIEEAGNMPIYLQLIGDITFQLLSCGNSFNFEKISNEFRAKTKALYTTLWDKDLNKEEKNECIYLAKGLPSDDIKALKKLRDSHFIFVETDNGEFRFSSNAFEAYVHDKARDIFDEDVFLAEAWKYLTNNEKITLYNLAKEPKDDLEIIEKIVIEQLIERRFVAKNEKGEFYLLDNKMKAYALRRNKEIENLEGANYSCEEEK